MPINDNSLKQETIDLLKTLGVEDNNQNSRIYNKFWNKYLTQEINNPGSVDYMAINQELKVMIETAKIAEAQALDTIKRLGILPKLKAGQPNFQYSWNEHYMCYVATLETSSRKVEIKLLGSWSNNNWHSDDIIKTRDSKFAAAESLSKNPDFIEAIQAVKKSFDVHFTELCDNFDGKTTPALSLKEVIKANEKIQNEFIYALAAEIDKFGIKPENGPIKKGVKAAVNLLQEKEIQIISVTTRPILITAYEQKINDIDKKQILMSTNIPISNSSSAKRIFEREALELANYWRTINQAIILQADKENKYTRVDQDNEKIIESYRSSSPTQLVGMAKKTEEQKQLEIDVLENIITQQAIEQIIKTIHETGSLISDKGIVTVDRNFGTFLSPVFIGSFGGRIIARLAPLEFFKRILVRNNEKEQLKSMKRNFDAVNEKKIPLLDHIELILGSCKDMDNIDLGKLRTELEKVKIQPRISYINNPVNKLRLFEMKSLQIVLGKLDFGWYNYFYNSKYSKITQERIIIHLEKYSTLLSSNRRLIACLHKKITNKNWAEIKAELEGFLRKEYPEGTEQNKIIQLFIRIQDSLRNTSTEKNSSIARGFATDLYAFQLNNILGVPNHTNCKSGKDRTGLFELIVQASLGPTNRLIENLCIAICNSAAKDLNVQNAPGCRGIQIDADILDGLVSLYGEALGSTKPLRDLIEEQQLRRIGSFQNVIFIRKPSKYSFLSKKLGNGLFPSFSSKDTKISPVPTNPDPNSKSKAPTNKK